MFQEELSGSEPEQSQAEEDDAEGVTKVPETEDLEVPEDEGSQDGFVVIEDEASQDDPQALIDTCLPEGFGKVSYI